VLRLTGVGYMEELNKVICSAPDSQIVSISTAVRDK